MLTHLSSPILPLCNAKKGKLVKFGICAEFLHTKLSLKSNFETSEGKHEFQARYVILVIMADYIPRSGNLFISCNARIFGENKKNKNLVDISKDFLISIDSKITETRLTTT